MLFVNLRCGMYIFAASVSRRKTMSDRVVTSSENMLWEMHPHFTGVRLAKLVENAAGAAVRCALVGMNSTSAVAEHAHDEEDDMFYVLQGHAVMWTEMTGDVPITAGSFVRVPKGIRHRPHSFSDGFRIFNIWAKAPFSSTNTDGDHHD
jgi:mannose-6-phosphate isomerase-like protein (cupin superfamily)